MLILNYLLTAIAVGVPLGLVLVLLSHLRLELAGLRLFTYGPGKTAPGVERYVRYDKKLTIHTGRLTLAWGYGVGYVIVREL